LRTCSTGCGSIRRIERVSKRIDHIRPNAATTASATSVATNVIHRVKYGNPFVTTQRAIERSRAFENIVEIVDWQRGKWKKCEYQ
jgi:hypothetical protein